MADLGATRSGLGVPVIWVPGVQGGTMRGRSGLVAILAGIALVAVAACGAGSPQVFHPAGSPPPTAQADTVRAPATTAPGGFRSPPGVSIEFSSPLPGGADKRAIV